MFRVDCDVGMIAFVGEEWSYVHSGARGVVVCEFGERKEFRPIVLLVVAEYVKVLFQHLIKTFSLSVAFWVIAQSEVNLHI